MSVDSAIANEIQGAFFSPLSSFSKRSSANSSVLLIAKESDNEIGFILLIISSQGLGHLYHTLSQFLHH